MILARGTVAAEDLKDLRSIQTHASYLSSFLNDMLVTTKLEAGQLILNRSLVDVNQLMQEMKESFSIVAQSKQIKFACELPSKSQEILLDPNLFQRVLDNLISNALKFSPAGGTVTLQVEYPQVELGAGATEPELRLKVLDEGTGIAEEHRDRIFDKFEIVALKQNGAAQVGLGLAFCKMVVEAHGGRIFVENNHPVGSVFTIEL